MARVAQAILAHRVIVKPAFTSLRRSAAIREAPTMFGHHPRHGGSPPPANGHWRYTNNRLFDYLMLRAWPILSHVKFANIPGNVYDAHTCRPHHNQLLVRDPALWKNSCYYFLQQVFSQRGIEPPSLLCLSHGTLIPSSIAYLYRCHGRKACIQGGRKGAVRLKSPPCSNIYCVICKTILMMAHKRKCNFEFTYRSINH